MLSYDILLTSTASFSRPRLAMLVKVIIAKLLWRHRSSESSFHRAVTRGYSRTTAGSVLREIKTQVVPRLDATQTTAGVDLASLSTPVIWSGTRQQARAVELMNALRQGEDNLIEVELGRYDHPGAFDRVTMRLGQYLDWLDVLSSPDGAGRNKIDGRQVYLAQWRGADEVSSAIVFCLVMFRKLRT